MDHGHYDTNLDFWLEKAMRDIKTNYGHETSVALKGKDLLKYGRSAQVSSSKTSIMTLPAGVLNETYVSDNLITTVSSGSTLDTAANNASDLILEGHTIDLNGNLTFVSQPVTLNGQNQVTLTTPLARATRAYNNDSAEITGPVYFYEDDTSTAGVPDTSSLVHLMIRGGEQQSEKAGTSMSSTDYWIITGVYASVLDKAGSPLVDVDLEVRSRDGVFRKRFDFGVSNSGMRKLDGMPYQIVRPNSDVVMRATSSASNTEVSAGIYGTLLKIV